MPKLKRPPPPIDAEDVAAGMVGYPRNTIPRSRPALRMVREGRFEPFWSLTSVPTSTREALSWWGLVEFRALASDPSMFVARLTPRGMHIRDKAIRQDVEKRAPKPAPPRQKPGPKPKPKPPKPKRKPQRKKKKRRARKTPEWVMSIRDDLRQRRADRKAQRRAERDSS